MHNIYIPKFFLLCKNCTLLLHIQVYYYAESKTTHTTYPDGLEVIEFPKYMVELCCNVHSGGPSAHRGRADGEAGGLVVRQAGSVVG